ncbi:MAG: hypothetical protein M3P34_01330, partial [Actinomycetota bacterium]|nr:hypothetical protein [Actinomycetota bacterium]
AEASLVSFLVLVLAIAGVGGAPTKGGGGGGGGGGDNACPPPSPGFPNQDPPSCGKKSVRPPPPPCQGTLAEDIFVGTREVPVASGVIQNPDGAGPVSTPVGNAVTGLTTAELGNQAGCAVSLTGL